MSSIVPFAAGELRPADQHPVAVYLAGLAPGSRRTQRAALRFVADHLAPPGELRDLSRFPWSALRHQHLMAIRQRSVDGDHAPATTNRILAAVRAVLRACWRLGYLDGDTYQHAIDIPPAHGSSLPAGRALTRDELTALLRSCRQDPDPYRGARDAAVLALLFGAGLRRAEVVAVMLEDIPFPRTRVRVHGKGHCDREEPLAPRAAAAIAWWISHRGERAGPLILPVDGAVRRISAQSVYMLLRRRARWAGVAAFSPHDLRRSYISDGLDRGVDLRLMQQLAGHARVETTAGYDRRPARRLDAAAARLWFPF